MASPRLVAAIFVAVLLAWPVAAVDNGLGRTPQMGWNSWNQFACNITEQIMMETADALVSTGLAELGYRYCNVDDCWAYSRAANGTIQSDPVTFPSGLAFLASYMHALGLRFGAYSDLGNLTCAGRPGSLGYETLDADTWAAWQLDYMKIDNCNAEGLSPLERYPVMARALNESGRDIFFSLCEWGENDPAKWAPALGNSWRTTVDIKDLWVSVMHNLDENNKVAAAAGPGGWNDPDMLEVGVQRAGMGLSQIEQVSHFSLWALIKAPLILGMDVRNISDDALAIITNAEVIAVNQDPLGVQGKRVRSSGLLGSSEVWAGPLASGAVAVVLFNRDPVLDAEITAHWSDIGLHASAQANVRDLWQHVELGSFKGSFTAKVAPHGVVMVTVTPSEAADTPGEAADTPGEADVSAVSRRARL